MNRRWMLGGVAVASVAAGAGVAQWRAARALADGGSAGAGEGVSSSGSSGVSGIGATSATADAALWNQRFKQPGGAELVMAALRGQPVLLNFWATWCAPCIKEMPLLDAFFKQHQAAGWHVVGLAIDSPTPVRDYLAKLPMSFPIGLAGMEGVELTRSLGNANGALPFSVVFDRSGKVLERKLGQIENGDFARWLKAVS